MKKRILIGAFIWIGCGSLMAMDLFSNDFGPYRDDETVQKTPFKELDELENRQENIKVLIRRLGLKEDLKAPYWIIRTDGSDPQRPMAQLELHVTGRKKPFRLKLKGWEFYSAATVDMNGDGKADFILEATRPQTEEEGEEDNSFPSRNRGMLLVLSDHKTYKAYWLEGTLLGMNGVIPMSQGKGSQIIISTEFTEKRMDKKLKLTRDNPVLFHLYQLISIRGANAALENRLDPRYPKIVAQDLAATHKNHKETKLLTDDRKKEIYNQLTPKIVKWPFEK